MPSPPASTEELHIPKPSHIRNRRVVPAVVACAAALLIAATPAGAQRADRQVSERELAEVRGRIEKLREKVSEKIRRRDALTAELATAERDIAAATRRQREVGEARDRATATLAGIGRDIEAQRQALGNEQQVLGRQLRAAYTSGRQERAKLILNQGSPAELGRMLVYYRYLNDARGANITALRAAIGRLAALMARAEAERAELARLAAEQERVVARLDAARRERAALLARTEAQIASADESLQALRQQEEDLVNLIAELSGILAEYPINSEAPFSELRGKLTWPVPGRARRQYGESRASGRLRWKGVVLEAPAGDEVRAIYHGRVAYADWLPGLGLLMIVDHGDGYLSLYGHNETLLKRAGDWISPGDVIATVGNSGGRAEPGLYFELRRGQSALNPGPWFKRRPGASR